MIFKGYNLEDPDLSAAAVTQSLSQLILTPDYFCNRVVKLCDFVKYYDIDDQQDIAGILTNKPKSVKSNKFVNDLHAKIAKKQKTPRKTLRVLHIADPHLDLWY